MLWFDSIVRFVDIFFPVKKQVIKGFTHAKKIVLFDIPKVPIVTLKEETFSSNKKREIFGINFRD